MSRLPLNIFVPFDSKERIDNFLKYLLALKQKDRYRLSDCISLFTSEKWKEYFLEKSREYSIFSSRMSANTEFTPQEEKQKINAEICNNSVSKKKERIPTVRPKKEYIAKDIRASDLNIGDGIITYEDYSLKSPLIKKFSKRISAKVPYFFVLVKDYTKNNSFVFEPTSDLDLLLTECQDIFRENRGKAIEAIIKKLKAFSVLSNTEEVDDFIKSLFSLQEKDRLSCFDKWFRITLLQVESSRKYFCDLLLDKHTFPGSKKIVQKINEEYKRYKSINKESTNNAISNNNGLIVKENISNSEIKKIESQSYNRFFTGIKASELTVEKGIIKYGEYSLKSVRINTISKKILSKIDHLFKLKVIDAENRSFIFEPANDLSFLLAESERIREQRRKNRENKESKVSTDPLFPVTGEFELPWRYVKFEDRILYLLHPNQNQAVSPYFRSHFSILKSFRDILPYIEKKCLPFHVIAQDNTIINVSNFYTFEELIPQFNEYIKLNDEEIELEEGIESKPRMSFSISDFRKLIRKEKSKYLHLLSEIHIETRPVFYILENIVHESNLFNGEEHGYLFTIRENDNHSLIVYENVVDESRSSIRFCVERSQYNFAIDAIRRFWASDVKNKRQKLLNDQISFNNKSILTWDRIFHDGTWECYMKMTVLYFL